MIMQMKLNKFKNFLYNKKNNIQLKLKIVNKK